MPVQSAPRLTLRAFESTRRASWLALFQQSVGLSAEFLVIGGFLTLGWLEARVKADEGRTPDQAVSFLAPMRKSAPPPSEERLSFVGLGNAHVFSPGDVAAPSDHGLQSVALAPRGANSMEEDAVAQPESDSPRAMTEIEVDSTAALDPSAQGPEYPPDLMQAGVQGVVYAQFVVDSTGYADTLSMQVLDQVAPQFVQAVKNALPRMKYKAAVFAGKHVNQLVQQAFVFRIQSAAVAGGSAPVAAPGAPVPKIPPG